MNTEKKQSSIEFAKENLKNYLPSLLWNNLALQQMFREVEAKHKEEIEDAWMDADGGGDYDDGQDYYIKTFGETKN